MDIFEKASRLKLRFTVIGRGNLSAEDLWDLTERQLDSIYASLAEYAQKQDVKRLMDANRMDDGVSLRMSLIEHVFNVKKAEREARAAKASMREEFNRLLDIKAKKKDAALEGLSDTELDTKLAEIRETLENS